MAEKKNKTKAVNDTQSDVEVKKTAEEKRQIADAQHRISRQNVLIIIIVIAAIILVAIYIYFWQSARNEEKYRTSYLLSSGTVSLEIKNLEEVSQVLSESPTEYFVLITYTGNEDTYNLEESIKSIIDDYKLSDSFYYLNIENIIQEDNYIIRLNSAFNTDKITTVPTILYFRDGAIVDTVTRDDDNIINAGDFQKLLDIYEYEGQ